MKKSFLKTKEKSCLSLIVFLLLDLMYFLCVYFMLILEKLFSSIFYFLGQMYENIIFHTMYSDHYMPQKWACVLSCFSHVWLLVTLWTVACQALLSIGFSRWEYWSGGLPFPTPWDLPDPGNEPASLMCPALAGRFFTTSATWEAQYASTRYAEHTINMLDGKCMDNDNILRLF